MPKEIFPSSFLCDCGHQVDFFENTVEEMKRLSRRSRQRLAEGGPAETEHVVVFENGGMVDVLCPGRRRARAVRAAPATPPPPEPPGGTPDDSLQQLAVVMAVNCVRNTCIETYHAQGKLTDAEMKAFNQEVADRIYTFLEVLFSRPKDEWQAFLADRAFLAGNAVQTWDKPKFREEMWRGTKRVSKSDARFTPKQGRYLAFIQQYRVMHGRAPAEADLQAFFRVSPPAVHQMVLTLEKKGLIQRTPGQARSIKVLVPVNELPRLT